MKLDDYQSINEIPETELLKFILANQFSILRRLSFIEHEISKRDIIEYESDIKQFVNKTDTSIKRINEFLSKSDFDKGQLKF